MGEAKNGAKELEFDGSIKLEFRGAKVTTDAEENIRAIARFIAEKPPNVERYDLLAATSPGVVYEAIVPSFS